MQLNTFDALVDAFFDKCKEVMKTKGADYTKQSDNKLANFERIAAQFGNLGPRQVIAIYQGKHRDAIDSYMVNGTLESSESLEMRFVDEINYDLLMIAQAIAWGYAPVEDWLKLGMDTERKSVENESAKPATPSEPSMRTLDFGRTGQACCNPDGDECCDASDDR
jgi:hypothetical protein